MGQSDWTDIEMLRALHMRDHLKMSASEIGNILSKSRSGVLGVFFRVRQETDRHDPTGHLNGTMKQMWWKR